MFNNNKDTEMRLQRLITKLEDHEKQHTKEHWLVIALLAASIAIQVAGYVGT